MNATLRLPLVRVVLHPLLGVVIAGMCFSAGWFMRYSMRQGIGGATQLFSERLFGAFSMRPPKPKPTPSPSASASPATTTTTATASPSAAPHPTRRATPAVDVTVKSEMLELILGVQELQKVEKDKLRATIAAWKTPGAPEVILLAEAVNKLVYVKDPVRRVFVFRLLSLGTVMKLFKMDPSKADEPERIGKGWDVPDIRAAFDKGGVDAVRKLAAGRPAQFFVDLKKVWAPWQLCRENLAALKEGKGKSDTPTGAASPGATPSRDDTPAAGGAECPLGGTYTEKSKGVWSCSIHQTLDQPFAEAARLQWYIEPVEEALRSGRVPGQLQGAVDALSEVLRLHPNHVWAIDAMNDLLADGKSWAGLKTHLERYLPQKDANLNARWAWLMARACHEQLEYDNAKKYAGRTQNAVFAALPPNIPRVQDFYIYKDRALEIYNAANDKNRPEEYPFRKDEEQPSQVCVRNLTEIRTAVLQLVKGYPASHPDLSKLREKKKLAAEYIVKTPPGPKLDGIKAKAKVIDDRIAQIMGDTEGKGLWKALVKFLAGYQINGCPAGGRYTLERHQWLDCSKHREILGERLEWEKHTPPTTEEEVQLSRAILKGALAADPKRRACFEAQKAYVASRGAEGVQPGEITTSTKLPSGEPLTCPSGKIEAVATGATSAQVHCTYHGSYEEYFAGLGELKEGQ